MVRIVIYIYINIYTSMYLYIYTYVYIYTKKRIDIVSVVLHQPRISVVLEGLHLRTNP